MNGEKNCCGGHDGGHGKHGHHKCAKAVLVGLGLILIGGVLVVALIRDRIVNPPYQTVAITGQGKVAYNPDLAILTVGVQVDKVAKADEALSQVNSKVSEIIKAVKALGIAEENIQTQNYSLYPQYDYKDNIQTVSGYSANQQLVIKVSAYDKEPNKLNQVIAAASKAGANQINGLSFDASNMNELKQQARVKAIEDAREKSRALADAANVKLKKITGWWENVVQPQAYYSADYAAKGGMGGGAITSSQTPSGSQEVIVEIGVNYSLR